MTQYVRLLSPQAKRKKKIGRSTRLNSSHQPQSRMPQKEKKRKRKKKKVLLLTHFFSPPSINRYSEIDALRNDISIHIASHCAQDRITPCACWELAHTPQ